MRRASYIGDQPGLGGQLPVGAIDFFAANPGPTYSICDGDVWSGAVPVALVDALTNQDVWGGFNNVDWRVSSDGSTGDNLRQYVVANGRHYAWVTDDDENWVDLRTKPNAASTTWTHMLTNVGPASAAPEGFNVVYFAGKYYTGKNSGELLVSDTGEGGWSTVTAAGAHVGCCPMVCDGRLWTGGFNPRSSADGATWTLMSSCPDTSMAVTMLVLVDGVYYLSGSNRSEVYLNTSGNPHSGIWTAMFDLDSLFRGYVILGPSIGFFGSTASEYSIHWRTAATGASLGARLFTSMFGAALTAGRAVQTNTGALFYTSDWKWAHLTAWDATTVLTTVRTHPNPAQKLLVADGSNVLFVSQASPSDFMSSKFGRMKPRIAAPNGKAAYLKVA